MSTKIRELQESQRQLEARNAALEVLARTAGASEHAEQQDVSHSIKYKAEFTVSLQCILHVLTGQNGCKHDPAACESFN